MIFYFANGSFLLAFFKGTEGGTADTAGGLAERLIEGFD
jgi:hypothetical protein